ncbi:hypothetical protein AB0K14_16755 [Actinosynnema sp. NPDC050801]|uniref:NACHT domain-containing protein n=1 Tax=unclassified Actinosynnema TaxID=2637065 RepID=UPI0033E2FE5C
MSRPDLFTYAGALRILGKYERPLFEKVDMALGGAILAGGALGNAGVLGLIDPKNEAMSSLRKVLDGLSTRLTGLSGVNRQELVSAAHTVIAVNSVFDAFRDRIGVQLDRLRITDDEKFRMLGVEPTGTNEAGALPALTELDVPAPDAIRGFQQNLEGPLTHFFATSAEQVMSFLGGLSSVRLEPDPHRGIVRESREKYVHHYLGLAASIPEFEVWTFIGEHSATRDAVVAGNARLAEALATQTESLERFARLLSSSAPGELRADRSYRRKLEKAALATLAKPLLRSNPGNQAVTTRFPSVERGFVAPRYRVTVHDEKAVPASEDWWSSYTAVEEDIDTFLAAHLSSPTGTARPLLVLGHPGAGKSLLMEVLAARLPAAGYTVVNVQLRKVNADEPVRRQIESALTEVLSEKVDWGKLADECDDTIRVVLLDGFDELVQASGVTQSNYIRQVCEFQEREADLGRPVAVVITSRTLVVDRARIPDGVPIVKLEEFDDSRVGKWLDAWNQANASTPGFHTLAPADLLRHGDLARQPLILLMLAIYAADAEDRWLDDEDLSRAALYERLIDSFVLRQARDKSRVEPSEQQVATKVQKSKWQLSIAALAMFNRGLQYVSDAELERDLLPFFPAQEMTQRSSFDDPLSLSDQTVGDFFFIHSAQLNAQDSASTGRRTYEFLHATFGEYLIAERTLKLLGTVLVDKQRRESNPFEGFGLLDDALLYSLISHDVFAKRRPILEFASGLFQALDPDVRVGVLGVLDELIRTVHQRVKNDAHPGYDPSGANLVGRIAAYTANLVCLRVHLVDSPVPLDSLFPGMGTDLDAWRSMVHLWHSGSDAEGWLSLLGALTLHWAQGVPSLISRKDLTDTVYVGEAQLLGDPVLEGTVRVGDTFIGSGVTADVAEQELLETLSRWVARSSGMGSSKDFLPYDIDLLDKVLDGIESGVPMHGDARDILLFSLSRESWRLPAGTVLRAVGCLGLDQPDSPLGVRQAFEVCSLVCAHPQLLDEMDGMVDRIVGWVAKNEGEALACLVLAWRTSLVAGGGGGGIDQLLAQLDPVASRIRSDLPRNIYFPVDSFAYLAGGTAVNWMFDKSLLVALGVSSSRALRKVRPQHFLAVVGKFSAASDEVRPADAEILGFVVQYLFAHNVEGDFRDLPSAMGELRRLAEVE